LIIEIAQGLSSGAPSSARSSEKIQAAGNWGVRATREAFPSLHLNFFQSFPLLEGAIWARFERSGPRSLLLAFPALLIPQSHTVQGPVEEEDDPVVQLQGAEKLISRF
jgi:hypothetical protein